MGRGLHIQSVKLVDAAVRVLEEIKPTTVRSVCYQLFTRGLIENMGRNETGNVSRLLTWAREHGQIEWSWIVDETREVEQVAQWSDGAHFIQSLVGQYRKDYWQDQPYNVELVSEKGTVRGVLAAVLEEFGVPFRVMHGFASATATNDMAGSINHREKPTVLLYVGDWDPSGMFMSEEDLPDRLERYGADPGRFQLCRIALTHVDVSSDALPYFLAETKKSDARYRWFIRKYGEKCWEVDAMNSNDLRRRVRNSIVQHLDIDAWNHMVEIERVESESMQRIMGDWKRALGRPSSP
ncbi:hypothetical protein B0G81_6630 [Paraburkholderia sp. BL6665CI2N2]|uniref:hypothetical protein n=1 Tax=Paraburkholderia sp. BL6665CI2N2 TaxID=1938806 RepID=UPI00106550FE|nr:hypothetical protein [Paraburkholderia sp. BL6665CI2N2]TDY26125.1 hypothetical protein B0G81_6630 [Paraburkholderia sp. BL6665CI2N2]